MLRFEKPHNGTRALILLVIVGAPLAGCILAGIEIIKTF